MTNTPKQRVIAVEEHFVTERYWSETENLAVSRGEEPEHAFMLNFPHSEYMCPRFTNVQKRLEEMDAAGIDVSVLSLNPPGVQIYSDTERAISLAKEMNDALAELIRQHNGRFAGVASVAPQDPDAAAAEVVRTIETLGLGGVMIASHTHGHYLDEPEAAPLLDALVGEDATLYLHPGCPSPLMQGPFLNTYCGTLPSPPAECSTRRRSPSPNARSAWSDSCSQSTTPTRTAKWRPNSSDRYTSAVSSARWSATSTRSGSSVSQQSRNRTSRRATPRVVPIRPRGLRRTLSSRLPD
jgi:hypothetical protein